MMETTVPKPSEFVVSQHYVQLYKISTSLFNTHATANFIKLYLVIRKKSDVFILAPADDLYYRWLFVIATAVLYNWCFVVAR